MRCAAPGTAVLGEAKEMTTVALAQLNLMVGDIQGNARRVIDCAERLRGSADISRRTIQSPCRPTSTDMRATMATARQPVSLMS